MCYSYFVVLRVVLVMGVCYSVGVVRCFSFVGCYVLFVDCCLLRVVLLVIVCFSWIVVWGLWCFVS